MQIYFNFIYSFSSSLIVFRNLFTRYKTCFSERFGCYREIDSFTVQMFFWSKPARNLLTNDSILFLRNSLCKSFSLSMSMFKFIVLFASDFFSFYLSSIACLTNIRSLYYFYNFSFSCFSKFILSSFLLILSSSYPQFLSRLMNLSTNSSAFFTVVCCFIFLNVVSISMNFYIYRYIFNFSILFSTKFDRSNFFCYFSSGILPFRAYSIDYSIICYLSSLLRLFSIFLLII